MEVGLELVYCFNGSSVIGLKEGGENLLGIQTAPHQVKKFKLGSEDLIVTERASHSEESIVQNLFKVSQQQKEENGTLLSS